MGSTSKRCGGTKRGACHEAARVCRRGIASVAPTIFCASRHRQECAFADCFGLRIVGAEMAAAAFVPRHRAGDNQLRGGGQVEQRRLVRARTFDLGDDACRIVQPVGIALQTDKAAHRLAQHLREPPGR